MHARICLYTAAGLGVDCAQRARTDSVSIDLAGAATLNGLERVGRLSALDLSMAQLAVSSAWRVLDDERLE